MHGILQARKLEWVATSFSRGSFPTLESNPGLLHCRQTLPTELRGRPQCVCKDAYKGWSGGQLNYHTLSTKDGVSSSLRASRVCAHLFPSLHGGNQRAKGPARDHPAGKQQRANSRRTVDLGEFAPQVMGRMPQAHPPSMPPVHFGSPTSPTTLYRVCFPPVLSTCCPLLALTLHLPGLVGLSPGFRPQHELAPSPCGSVPLAQAWVGLLSLSHICCATLEKSLHPSVC